MGKNVCHLNLYGSNYNDNCSDDDNSDKFRSNVCEEDSSSFESLNNLLSTSCGYDTCDHHTALQERFVKTLNHVIDEKLEKRVRSSTSISAYTDEKYVNQFYHKDSDDNNNYSNDIMGEIFLDEETY